MKLLLPFAILLLFSPLPSSAQGGGGGGDCRPGGCSSPGTYCCDRNNIMTCARDEAQCSSDHSTCSSRCRNGCCVDDYRCGTEKECKAFPIYSLIVGFGVLILFIVSVSIYRIRRTRQLNRLRIVAINGNPAAAHGGVGEMSIHSLIPTGVVVNPNRRIRGPPIKEVAVQPYQQQDIPMENKVMTQPYASQRQPQQFNYDQIEYALPPGTQQPMVLSQPNTVRL